MFGEDEREMQKGEDSIRVGRKRKEFFDKGIEVVEVET